MYMIFDTRKNRCHAISGSEFSSSLFRSVWRRTWSILEELEPPFATIVYPSMKHPSTVEIKDNLALPIHKLDADDPTFAFSSLVPSLSRRALKLAVIAPVPKGQWDASASLGMTWGQTMQRTILPQAARTAVPPLSNSFISLVKDTSLAAAITVPELFQAAQRIVAVTYEPLILYVEAALIYLAISSVLSLLQVGLERRFNRYGGFLGQPA